MIGNFAKYGEKLKIETNYTVKERSDLLSLIPSNFEINSILELGCADGKNLIYFKNFFNIDYKNTIGIDLCESITNKYDDFIFFHSSIEEFLKKNKKKFDLILFSDVLEHIYNPWDCLRRIHDHMNSNGLILLSVPNMQNIKYIQSFANGNFFYQDTGLFDQTHIRFFSSETLTKYVEESNFKIISKGWRPDQSMQGLKNQILNQLAGKVDTELKTQFFSLRINKNNIENYFGQQILICAQKNGGDGET